MPVNRSLASSAAQTFRFVETCPGRPHTFASVPKGETGARQQVKFAILHHLDAHPVKLGNGGVAGIEIVWTRAETEYLEPSDAKHDPRDIAKMGDLFDQFVSQTHRRGGTDWHITYGVSHLPPCAKAQKVGQVPEPHRPHAHKKPY